MQNKVQYLSGDFEGYFYTNQKVTLSQTDYLPTDGAHKIVLYKGELKNITIVSEFVPEKIASRDNLYLKNIGNIQLHNSIDDKIVFDKKIESFEYILLDDVKNGIKFLNKETDYPELEFLPAPLARLSLLEVSLRDEFYQLLDTQNKEFILIFELSYLD